MRRVPVRASGVRRSVRRLRVTCRARWTFPCGRRAVQVPSRPSAGDHGREPTEALWCAVRGPMRPRETRRGFLPSGVRKTSPPVNWRGGRRLFISGVRAISRGPVFDTVRERRSRLTADQSRKQISPFRIPVSRARRRGAWYCGDIAVRIASNSASSRTCPFASWGCFVPYGKRKRSTPPREVLPNHPRSTSKHRQNPKQDGDPGKVT
jgi:hypothetical protein